MGSPLGREEIKAMAREAARDAAHDVAEEAAEKAAHRVVCRLGLDSSNPRESYEDLLFLRRWRQATFKFRVGLLVSASATIVSGALALAWVGITNVMGR